MEYVANPVIVRAYKIERIIEYNVDTGEQKMLLDNGEEVTATKEMLSRIIPVVGDYWVIQPDGYIYLNPAEVFERKYSPTS